jgi:hypothetical protein
VKQNSETVRNPIITDNKNSPSDIFTKSTEADKQVTSKLDNSNSNQINKTANLLFTTSKISNQSNLENAETDREITGEPDNFSDNQVNKKPTGKRVFAWTGNKITGVSSGDGPVKILKAFPKINYVPQIVTESEIRSHIVIQLPKINFRDMRYRYGISSDAGTEQWVASL